MIYGYLRVSTDEQDINSQKQGVDTFAKTKNLQIDKYITDEGVSGGKDPKRRNLGPLLEKLGKGDILIASEISRLGRDLYMVMDILHFCMERECIIYTVKDNFVLGDDIQSKVLAFAFGLSAEIERQMIRQRTKEGLKLRVKNGILLGRPIGIRSNQKNTSEKVDSRKDEILIALQYGASQRAIAKKIGIDRNTLYRYLIEWGYKLTEEEKKEYELSREKKEASLRQLHYKESEFCIVSLQRSRIIELIKENKTIPEIHSELSTFTYEQIYDSILCDPEYNNLYRSHGQRLIKKVKL